jgi:hypothetical protein
MIVRRKLASVKDALARQAAVALIGPRQIGKTTLAFSLSEQVPALYLDLEASQDRLKLAEPDQFLKQYEDRLVILDEIHRMPELFSALRGIIDRGRRRGHRTGRFYCWVPLPWTYSANPAKASPAVSPASISDPLMSWNCPHPLLN